ncbi:hypothetical protein [Microbacterium sp. MPKO10]|uniref:hypothetical protein n=1 Tax=Microbacterium sp. MPKO10 TaxID=2989818 RepID=UPI002235AB54|nr:hypothetical protein [Microbacterium sp. MPKO10]MCW4458192.1 hypothetical protein [Microbacterium sp. MPKO10]
MADPLPPVSDNRAFAEQIAALDARLTTLEAPTGTQRTQVVAGLKAAVEAIPVTQVIGNAATGGAMPRSSSWQTITSATATVPEGKSRVSIDCMGMSAFRMNSPGGAWTPPQLFARVIVQGQVQAQVLSTDAYYFSSQTYLLFQAVTGGFFDGPVNPGDTVQVLYQMKREVNMDAFPGYADNYAQIASNVTFSGVI